MSPFRLRQLERGRLRPDTPLTEVPTALCGDFADVSQGLYVFLFANDTDLDVYDNNKKRKIVIHRKGASMKPGKFEQGFAFRLHNYNAHLHRTPPGRAPEWVLKDCFVSGFLLDLSEAVAALRAPARIFERYWTEAVNAHLEEHKLLADPPITQLGRAEWRYLQATRWSDGAGERLRGYLEQVAERIFHMAKVGGLPRR